MLSKLRIKINKKTRSVLLQQHRQTIILDYSTIHDILRLLIPKTRIEPTELMILYDTEDEEKQ